MTDLEDRLRCDLRQAAERIEPGSVRLLRAPRRRRVAGPLRWLAPVMAVAAVIGVIAGVRLAASSPGKPPSATASGGLPPYYVTVNATSVHSGWVRTVTVRDSVTGAPLSTVRLPVPPDPAAAYLDVTGAADDRTYLIEDDTEYLLLHVAANGRSAHLSRPPVTLPNADLTLSPDGDMVAFDSASHCSDAVNSYHAGQSSCRYNEVGIVSLATGATRVWSTRALLAGFRYSWVSDDQILLTVSSATSSVPSGDYLLNVANGGGDLLAAERLPVPPPPVYKGISYAQPSFLTPDRSAVITSAFGQAGSEFTREIVEYSASSGALIRVLYANAANIPSRALRDWTLPPYVCTVQSLAAAGVNALVDCQSVMAAQSPVFGRVDDGQFTTLPAVNGPVAW